MCKCCWPCGEHYSLPIIRESTFYYSFIVNRIGLIHKQMNFITDLFTFTESLEFIRSLKLIAVRLVLFSMLGGSISLTRRRSSSGVGSGVESGSLSVS